MGVTQLFFNKCEDLRVRSGLFDLDSELLITVLSSFITQQNIVVTADNGDATGYVQCCLELIASNILGIEDVVTVTFRETTAWEDVEETLLEIREYAEQREKEEEQRRHHLRKHSAEGKRRTRLPRFMILKDLNRASREIQSLVVQGLVTKKVVCEGVEYPLPDTHSIVVSLINLKRGRGVEGLMPHLKDLFFFRHHVNFEDETGLALTRQEIRGLGKRLPNMAPAALVTEAMIDEVVAELGRTVVIPEVKVYMQDIVVFLRTHRLVQSGRAVSPKAVKDFDKLVRILCVVRGGDYATPSLVAAAARKLFPLKVDMCRGPELEPTLHYGSDIKLVTQWMRKWDAELIIEDVLNIVPAPL